jgi:hypothetical protein
VEVDQYHDLTDLHEGVLAAIRDAGQVPAAPAIAEAEVA